MVISRMSLRNTMNSSPPVRPTISVARNMDCRRTARFRSTSSPKACPMVSLIFLKLSTSRTNNTPCLSGYCSIYSRILRSVAILLFRSVSRSVSALSSRTLLCSETFIRTSTLITVITIRAAAIDMLILTIRSTIGPRKDC